VVAVEQLVDDHAQAPDVALAAVGLLVVDELRAHVQRRADLGDLVVQVDVLQNAREAEVRDLDLLVVHQDVRGLQVPVHDVVLVQHDEGLHDLRKEDYHLRLRDELAAAHQVLQVPLVAKLLEHVDVLRRHAVAHQVHDVLAAHLRQQPHRLDLPVYQLHHALVLHVLLDVYHLHANLRI
jgi:hypothetical protein